MKIAQISDTHLGITTEGQLRVMFRDLAKKDFDLIVHCGDWCGGVMGHRKVRDTLRLLRKYLPNQPVIATIGNHDYWCHSNKRKKVMDFYTGRTRYIPAKPGPDDYLNNLKLIEEHFEDHNVHFLDRKGIYVHPDFPSIVFIGVSGWYANPYPPTRDASWLPLGMDGDTHRYILRNTERDLHRYEESLKDFDASWQNLVFVSHFPVINTGPDYKGSFYDFSWSESIGQYYQETYNCKFFLNGHAHQLHQGPLRWECGSDYMRPKYQLIEVP